MKAELKRKWVEALREPGAKQCREILKNPETGALCCIGVGFEAIVGKDAFVAGTSHAISALRLREPIGSKLVEMNDDEGLTFPQIADWIEQNVPEDDVVLDWKP